MNLFIRSRFRLPVLLLILAAALTVLPACEKEPGPGGKATLYGKVLVKDYNATFTVLQETYYGPEIWVYLIYGDNRDYGDRIQTGPGGTWEFRYLRPGKYRVYAFSKDSTLQTGAPVPVTRDVEIPGNSKQEVEVPDLIIFN